MSVLRRVNVVSQQRWDSNDMKSLESAASNDFDELIKSVVTGTTRGYVLRGFEISMAGAVGGAASGLQMSVDPGSVLHINSSQSGTFLLVPTGTPVQQLNSATNTIVDGAFAPSAINYVGIEYERYLDPSTNSQVYIWDPTTNTETTKIVPRAQILRYRIKITTSTWASNVLPIATVTTDTGNNVVSITDSRWMLFRLGQGGSSPNPSYLYPWTAQSEGRVESPSSSSNNSVNPFHGGDKMLGSLKDWMDSIMTSIQEIKGTTYWYSSSSAGSIETLREDLANTLITGKGTISHSATVAGRLNWSQDIYAEVVGSRLAYKLEANASSSDISLADGQVAYISMVRGVQIIPNLVFTNGSAIITSVGAVAWTSTLEAGDWVKLGSDTDALYYEILTVDSSVQVTLTETYAGSSTGAGGSKAKYAFGNYRTNPAPSTTRHITIADRKDVPAGQDIFWLFSRSDNAGTTPRIYLRFLGSELEQGEDRDVSDNQSLETLEYIGSPMESAYLPGYVSALNPGSLPQITDLAFGSAATISSNQYFFISNSDDSRKYYVWFNKDGTGSDPFVAYTFDGIEVAISTGNTSAQVAVAVQNALNLIPASDFLAAQRSNPNQHIVRVTNTSAGACTLASNVTVGAPFAVTNIQTGTGTGNQTVKDGDNLTLAIKELDRAVAELFALVNDPCYDEVVEIVASGEVPPLSLNAPITVGTNIQLPDNTRRTGVPPQYYTVGDGALSVYLNGQFLRVGTDWTEVGSAGNISNEIQTQIALVAGDILEFRLQAVSGSGGSGIPGVTGATGAAGVDAVGGPIAISTKTGNYTVLTTDNVLLGDCSGGAITFTLPTAAAGISQVFYLKKIDSSINALTVKGDGAELIDGINTKVISVQYDTITVVSDGSTWYIL